MKILVIEYDTYLAQSIELTLNEVGYECELVREIEEGIEYDKYDVVLLSTDEATEKHSEIIKKNKERIIILMPIIKNESTVFKLIREGATDYIMKPFIMSELVREIEHYKEYKELKREQSQLVSNGIEHKEKLFQELNDSGYLVGVKGQKEGDILSIENYVKSVVLKYEDRYTDTEISHKLGISRKCLWEKRKKLQISKKREREEKKDNE